MQVEEVETLHLLKMDTTTYLSMTQFILTLFLSTLTM